MKIVCISDTHSNQIELPEGDILIHAGDLTNSGSFSEVNKMLYWLGRNRDKYKHVLFTPGNHDEYFSTDPYDAQLTCKQYGITYVQDRMVEIEGVSFLGSPWTPIFGRWAYMTTEYNMVELYSAFPQVDILFTHGPPYGILDELVIGDEKGKHCGSRALLGYVQRNPPQHHIFGHIHRHKLENQSVTLGQTTFHNVAQVDEYVQTINTKKPVIIEI